MKAALKTTNGEFEIDEVELPRLQHPDWVLARVKVSGICGTDLRHWKKEEPDLVCKIMGHELAGEVVDVGEAVTNVKPGDRVVIETVTGGDSGIGRAIAIAFAREGADVLISYLNEDEDAKETARYVENAGQKAVLLAGDIRSEEQCKKIIDTAIVEFGQLDILVNNAAFQMSRSSLQEIPLKNGTGLLRPTYTPCFIFAKWQSRILNQAVPSSIPHR